MNIQARPLIPGIVGPLAASFRRLRAPLLVVSTCWLSGCVIDPNAWPTTPPPEDNGGYDAPRREGPVRKLIKPIQFSGGQVSYFRTSNSAEVAADKGRICLENNTGQPKSLRWTKSPSWANNLVARTNGARQCVNFNLNQRVEWVFFDRGLAKHRDAMNLGSTGGLLYEFIWVRDY